MPTDSPGGMRRYDVNDPEDMAALIRTGLIWRGGPNTTELAVEYLLAHPEAVNDKVPASVLAVLADDAEPEPVSDEELDMAPPAVDEEEDLASPAP